MTFNFQKYRKLEIKKAKKYSWNFIDASKSVVTYYLNRPCQKVFIISSFSEETEIKQDENVYFLLQELVV